MGKKRQEEEEVVEEKKRGMTGRKAEETAGPGKEVGVREQQEVVSERTWPQEKLEKENLKRCPGVKGTCPPEQSKVSQTHLQYFSRSGRPFFVLFPG